MKGLLRKDILMVGGNIGFLLIFIILYTLLSFFTGSIDFTAIVLILIMVMLPFNTLSYDELYQWDRYVLTLPVSRKQVIQSKYMFTLLLAVIALVFCVTMGWLFGGDWRDVLLRDLIFLASALLTVAVALPCALKWGLQKGRLIMILLCGIAGGMIGGLGIITEYGGGLRIVLPIGVVVTEELIVFGALGIALLALLISYKISCKIYEKKQF